MVAFDGDEGDVGATAVVVVAAVAAPAGTDCDDSVGVVAGGGGEFAVVPTDPRPNDNALELIFTEFRF